jgi:hypothetical protein
MQLRQLKTCGILFGFNPVWSAWSPFVGAGSGFLSFYEAIFVYIA